MKRKILTFTNKISKGLSRHLEKGTPAKAAASYLQMIKTLVPSEPVIHIDDSDVVKPNGYKFESLGIVRDGSESTSTKNVYKKGYHVTDVSIRKLPCTEALCNHKSSKSCEEKSFLLLLPIGERHLWYTFICKRGRQALVSNKTSGIPSTLP